MQPLTPAAPCCPLCLTAGLQDCSSQPLKLLLLLLHVDAAHYGR